MFGQSQQSTNSIFGGAQQSGVGGLFGGQQAPSAGLFGGAPAQGMGGGGGGLFGNPAGQQASTGGLFGQPQQSAQGGLFGQPKQAGLFGQPNNQPSPFSLNGPSTSTSQGNVFGAAPSTGGLFGGGGATTFGQQQTQGTGFGLGGNTMGGLQNPSPFGGIGGNMQQQPQQSMNLFGGIQSNQTQPQTGGLFGGQPSGGLFGGQQQQQQSNQMFNQNTSNPSGNGIFGATNGSGGGILGGGFNMGNNTGGIFGGIGNNNNNNNNMNNNNNATNQFGFGNQLGSFGQNSNALTQPFQPKKSANEQLNQKQTEKNVVYCISNGTDMCLFELSLAQRKLIKQGQIKPDPSKAVNLGFGQGQQQQQQQQNAGGLFQQPTLASNTSFNNPAPSGGGLFGAPANQTQGGGLFGQKPAATGGLFGQANPSSGGLFGGANPPSGGGLFGQPQQQAQTGGLFGAPSAQPTQGTGGLFGAPAAQNTGGLFGGQTTQQGGLFGNPTAPSGGLFGASAQPTSQPAPFSLGGQQQQTGGGLFGAAPSLNLGGGGLFGQTPQQSNTGGLFGQIGNNQQAQTGGLFGGQNLSAAPQMQMGAQAYPQGQTQFQSLLNYIDTNNILSENKKINYLDEDLEPRWVYSKFKEDESQGYYQRNEGSQSGESTITTNEYQKLYGYQQKSKIINQFKDIALRDSKDKQEALKKSIQSFTSGSARSHQSSRISERLSSQSEKLPRQSQTKQDIPSQHSEYSIDFVNSKFNQRIKIPIKSRYTYGDLKNEILSKFVDDNIPTESVRSFRLQARMKGENQAPKPLKDSEKILQSSGLSHFDIDYVELVERTGICDSLSSIAEAPNVLESQSDRNNEVNEESEIPQKKVQISDEFTCYPSIKQLNQMSDAALRRVENFTIENSNVRIVFDETVNLLNADLNGILLEENKISLENVVDSERLNKPCVVQFKKFGLKQLNNGKSKEEVIKLVKNLTKKMKLEVLKPYDVETTTLIYRQDGFNV